MRSVMGINNNIRDDVTVVAVSAIDGGGLTAWREASVRAPGKPLAIDYDRYAAAEALLGWANGTVELESKAPFSPAQIASRFFAEMASAPLAHLKLTGIAESSGSGAAVQQGGPSTLRFDDAQRVVRASWLINARVALPVADLRDLLQRALALAAEEVTVVWREFECFQPGRPTPKHRYSYRCGSSDEGSCCAAFYDRDDVRALLGDSWHPGGVELTLEVASRLGLAEGRRVLDVACGNGASLLALHQRFGIAGSGLDREARRELPAPLRLLRGDAHQIPLEDGSFDALLCECALSTFVDQTQALREFLRVLKPGGRVAITDMAVEGELPETLRGWVHTGTCLAGALTRENYRKQLESAGLSLVTEWDASAALGELLRRIKRNLDGAAFAAATGNLGRSLKLDLQYGKSVLKQAEQAVAAGLIRYTALIAERPV